MPPNPYSNPFTIPGMLGQGAYAVAPRRARPRPSLAPLVAPRPAPLQPMTEGEKSSLLGDAWGTTIGGLEYIGGAIDKPFAAARGLVSGITGGPWGGPWDNPLGSLANVIPFSDTMGITDPADRVFGRDILRNAGLIGQQDTWGNFAAGLALDVFIAPPLPGGPAAAAMPKLARMRAGMGAAGKAARGSASRLTRMGAATDDALARLGASLDFMSLDLSVTAKAVDTFLDVGGYQTQSMGQMIQEIRQGARGLAGIRSPWVPFFPSISLKTMAAGNLGLGPLAKAITGDATRGAQWAANIAEAGLYGRFSPIRYTRPFFSQAVEATGFGGREMGVLQQSKEAGWVADQLGQGVVSDTWGAFEGVSKEMAEEVALLLKNSSIAGDDVGATFYRELTQMLSEQASRVEGAKNVMQGDLLTALRQSGDLTEQALKLNETYARVAPYVRVKGKPPVTPRAPAPIPAVAPPATLLERLNLAQDQIMFPQKHGLNLSTAPSYDDITKLVADIGKQNNRAGVDQMAKEFGIPGTFRSKKDALAAIEKRLSGLRQTQERVSFYELTPAQGARPGGAVDSPLATPEVAPQTLAEFVEHFASQSPDDASRLTLNAKEIFNRLDVDDVATPAVRAATADFSEQIADALRHSVRDQRAREVMEQMGLNGQVLNDTHLGIAQEFSYEFAGVLDEQYRLLMDSQYAKTLQLGGRGGWMTSNFLSHSPLRPSDPVKGKAWDDHQARLGLTTEFAKHRRSLDIPERARTYNRLSSNGDVTKPFKSADEAMAWGRKNGVPEEDLAGIYRSEADQRHGMVYDLFSGRKAKFASQAEAEAFLTKQGVPPKDFYGAGKVDELLALEDPTFGFPDEWIPKGGTQLYRGIGQVSGTEARVRGPAFWTTDREYALLYGHGADDALLRNKLREDANLLNIADLADDSFYITRDQLEKAAKGLPDAMGVKDRVHLEKLWDGMDDLGTQDLVHTRLREAGYDGAKWFEGLAEDVTDVTGGAEAFLLSPEAMEPLNVSTKELRRLHIAETELRPALERAIPGLKGRTLDPKVPADRTIIQEMQRQGILNPRILAERKIMKEMGYINPKGKARDGGLINSVVDEEAFHWFDEVRGSTVAQGTDRFTLRQVDEAFEGAGQFDIESAREAIKIAKDAGLVDRAKDGSLLITKRGWDAKKAGSWLVEDADVASVATQLSKYMGELPLHMDGIYNQSLLTDVGDYMHSVVEANSNLFTIHHFLGGMIRMGRESPSGEMITLKQAWRGPKMKGGKAPQLTDEGLVTLVKNNGSPKFLEQVQQIEADTGLNAWTKKKQVRKLAVAEAETMMVPGKTVKAMDVYTKMMDPKSAESTAIGQVYNQFTALFKSHATLPHIAHHTRNRVSGFYQNLSSEAPNAAYTTAGFLKRDWELRKWAWSGGKGEAPQYLDEMVAQGMFEGGRSWDIVGEGVQGGLPEGGLKGILTPLRDLFRKPADRTTNVSWQPWRSRGVFADIAEGTGAQFGPLEAGERAYKMVELFNRAPPYMAARHAGLTSSQAKYFVEKIQYNYSNMTAFESKYIRNKIIPFYGWLRNNLPYQVSNIANFPGGKNATSIRMAYAAQRTSAGYTPKWLKEQLAFPFPSESPEKQTYIRQFGLPFEDLQNFSTDPARNMERFISQMNPIAGAMYSFISQKDPYSGRDLADMESSWVGGPTATMLKRKLMPFNRWEAEGRKLAQVGEAIVSPGTAEKSVIPAALDALTGMKLPTYDATQWELRDLQSAMRERVERSPYTRTFETPYVPERFKDQVPPDLVEDFRRLRALAKEIQQGREQRQRANR